MNRGVMTALITPLQEDERVDRASLESLVEWVIACGIKGIFVGGTIGEGPALRDTEKKIMFSETVRFVHGRVPVLANVSEMSTARSLDLVRIALEAGVDIIVSTTRFGFPPRTPYESQRHIETIARNSSVPVWFYENPGTTGITHSFQELAGITGLPNVKGLKFSSPDKDMFTRCVRELQNKCHVLTGNVPDIAYASSIGASGAVSGIGSLLPGLCQKIFQAVREGRSEEAKRLQKAVLSVYDIYGGKGWPLWPAAQKYVLKRRGIIRHAFVTAPFQQLGAAKESLIEKALAGIDENLFTIKA